MTFSAFAAIDRKNVLWDDYIKLRDTVYNSEKSAENISQNCPVKPVSYAISTGTKVAGFAKNVLKIK